MGCFHSKPLIHEEEKAKRQKQREQIIKTAEYAGGQCYRDAAGDRARGRAAIDVEERRRRRAAESLKMKAIRYAAGQHYIDRAEDRARGSKIRREEMERGRRRRGHERR